MPNKIKQQLQEALTENERINKQLIENEKLLDEANKQIANLNENLEKEKLHNAELCLKILELSNDADTSHDDSVFVNCADDVGEQNEDIKELERNCASNGENKEQGEDFKELKHHLQRRTSLTPINDLMLACTICGERIKLEELEDHSSICSSILDRRNSSSNAHQQPTTPTLPGMIVATVTTPRTESLSAASECTTLIFKVICKTTLAGFKQSLLVTERTIEHFDWFRNALEQLHLQSIIPPLKFKESLTENLREAQRFLSRVCAHDVLKCSPLTRKFFGASPKEFASLQSIFHRKVPPRLKRQKPAVEMVDEDGLIFRSQTYLSQLVGNLEAVTECVKRKRSFRSGSSDDLSQSFLALSHGDINETYLQSVSKALSDIIGDLENKGDNIYDEHVFAEDLESIVDYVKSADGLLSRVEGCINTYLYWEEEVRVLEEMKLGGLVTQTNETSIAQLWAEASANCRTGKNELEDMGKRLSDELISFDRRKEHELKQVFIEYAESRFNVFETFQSKWLAVKLILNSEIRANIRAIDLTA